MEKRDNLVKNQIVVVAAVAVAVVVVTVGRVSQWFGERRSHSDSWVKVIDAGHCWAQRCRCVFQQQIRKLDEQSHTRQTLNASGPQCLQRNERNDLLMRPWLEQRVGK